MVRGGRWDVLRELVVNHGERWIEERCVCGVCEDVDVIKKAIDLRANRFAWKASREGLFANSWLAPRSTRAALNSRAVLNNSPNKIRQSSFRIQFLSLLYFFWFVKIFWITLSLFTATTHPSHTPTREYRRTQSVSMHTSNSNTIIVN